HEGTCLVVHLRPLRVLRGAPSLLMAIPLVGQPRIVTACRSRTCEELRTPETSTSFDRFSSAVSFCTRLASPRIRRRGMVRWFHPRVLLTQLTSIPPCSCLYVS